jgi:hypothetical protein
MRMEAVAPPRLASLLTPSDPPWMLTPPVNVFVPMRSMAPAPFFVSPPAPLMLPENEPEKPAESIVPPAAPSVAGAA